MFTQLFQRHNGNVVKLTRDRLRYEFATSPIISPFWEDMGPPCSVTARIGNGEYDPATLGSALHAVIATKLMGQQATERVLMEYGMENTISVEAAEESADRLIATIHEHFIPTTVYNEYPIHYTNDQGQIISGWIDLLVETEDGFILIDHKASPRAKSDREEIALGYSGQLEAYAAGITQATGKPVINRWIHFAVTGGLVGVSQ